MTDAYRDDRIASWVDDFVAHPRFAAEPTAVRDHAPGILSEFLASACRNRDRDPGDVEEADLRPALLTGVAPLALPAEVRAGAVDLVAAFLEVMQDVGRLSGGRILAKYVRAMREEFRAAAGGKGTPIRKPAEKIGRNDPCPCGSGRKYKQCCLRALG